MTKAWPKPIIQSLPDQVAHAILHRVATGELQPCHRLPIRRDPIALTEVENRAAEMAADRRKKTRSHTRLRQPALHERR